MQVFEIFLRETNPSSSHPRLQSLHLSLFPHLRPARAARAALTLATHQGCDLVNQHGHLPYPARNSSFHPPNKKGNFLRKTHRLYLSPLSGKSVGHLSEQSISMAITPSFFAQRRETCSTRNSADFEPQLWRHHQICKCLWHRAKPRYKNNTVLAEWKTDSTISKQLCMTMKSCVLLLSTFPCLFQSIHDPILKCFMAFLEVTHSHDEASHKPCWSGVWRMVMGHHHQKKQLFLSHPLHPLQLK